MNISTFALSAKLRDLIEQMLTDSGLSEDKQAELKAEWSDLSVTLCAGDAGLEEFEREFPDDHRVACFPLLTAFLHRKMNVAV